MGTQNRFGEVVLRSTHNLCFEQECEKYQNFLSENVPYLVIKFSIYLNRCIFIMTEMLLKSTHNMFSWRNKKTILSGVTQLQEKYQNFWVRKSLFNPCPAEPRYILPLQTE